MRKTKSYIRVDRIRELIVPVKNNKEKYRGLVGFCNKVDYSYKALERVLYEGSDVSVATLVRISEEFGVTTDWLLGLSNKKYREEL